MKYQVLFIFLSLSINVQSQFLTGEQAVEDLQYLYKSIQNVHPDLYWFKAKSDADSDFNNLLEKVESGIDQEEFYKLTAEFVADFNTSHLNVTLPLLTLGDFSKSDKLNPLPVEVLFTSKGLFIKERISKNGTINERVGSTSQLFAQAFKCSKLGLIIGQETGEATIFFGDGPSLKLPNSNLQFSTPSKKIVSHCDKSKIHGIKPDYTVDYHPSKLLNGEDEVLNFT